MHFDHSKIFVTKFALKFTEFQMFQPSARPSATKGEAKGEKPSTSAFGRPLTPVLHQLPRVGPKQLCALAHLGCTRKAGTS